MLWDRAQLFLTDPRNTLLTPFLGETQVRSTEETQRKIECQSRDAQVDATRPEQSEGESTFHTEVFVSRIALMTGSGLSPLHTL